MEQCRRFLSLPAGDTALINVAATSASDVWAVGSQCSPLLSIRGCCTSPGPPGGRSRRRQGAHLTSVVAFAPDDVWIFGQATTPFSALDHIEHWDGTRFTPEPNVPPATTNPHHPASALSLAAAAGRPPDG